MTTTTKTTVAQTQTTATPRLAIKKEHLAGLDPEWVELWHTHGAHMTRADELSLEKYRKNPAMYSFAYPTCAGQSRDPTITAMTKKLLTSSRS
jgi:hypothetical protein